MKLIRLFHCSPSAMTLKELEAFAAEVYSKTSDSMRSACTVKL